MVRSERVKYLIWTLMLVTVHREGGASRMVGLAASAA